MIWGIYFALALAGTAWSVVIACDRGDADAVQLMSGVQTTLGLLLVSISAPTALAEERARGSLDVLMTTPLPTERIVLAKWWGAYRIVPPLALLPAIGALVVGFTMPAIPAAFARNAQTPNAVGWIDRVAFACLPTALMLAQGAVVTSFGLALATWMRRLGRAIAASVACYAAVAFGWIVLIELEIVPGILSWFGLIGNNDHEAWLFYSMLAATFCPFGAQMAPSLSVSWGSLLTRYAFHAGTVVALLITIGVAFLFLGLTLATFNRSMGRMTERSRRAPRPPRKVHTVRGRALAPTGSRDPVLAQLSV